MRWRKRAGVGALRPFLPGALASMTARRRRPVWAALAAACLLVGLGQASFAQSRFGGAPPCVLDKCLNGGTVDRQTAPRPDGYGEATAPPSRPGFPSEVAPGAFDFYVLALSWSPAFCQTPAGSRAGSQCEPGGRLGFVVHGLWPQNVRGYPSDCDSSAPPPSRSALDTARSIYPDVGLARHEWRKHGTCTGLSPTAYFAAVGRARAAIVIPESLRAPDDDRQWAPADIARDFTAANPRLRADTMAVTCRSGMLEEVRICMSKDLRGFVSCPEVARAACRRPFEVPPVL